MKEIMVIQITSSLDDLEKFYLKKKLLVFILSLFSKHNILWEGFSSCPYNVKS